MSLLQDALQKLSNAQKEWGFNHTHKALLESAKQNVVDHIIALRTISLSVGPTIASLISDPGTSSLDVDGEYTYRVSAVVGGSETATSLPSSTVEMDDPATELTLSWSAVSGATAYLIYRADTEDTELSDFNRIKSVVGLEYTDTGVDAPNLSLHPLAPLVADQAAITRATAILAQIAFAVEAGVNRLNGSGTPVLQQKIKTVYMHLAEAAKELKEEID